MTRSVHQVKFNNSVVTALLFNNLPLNEKELKLQQFVNEADDRYDLFCDNVSNLLENKDVRQDAITLYVTIDGFSFISEASSEHESCCFPVLTINKYSPSCSDISVYVEMALAHFISGCTYIKSATTAVIKTA